MTEASQFRTVASAAQRPRPIATARCLAAETIGTFWLVLGGCGAAVLAAGTSVPGSIGLVGVSLAFGLTVFTMAFAVGFISGGHFNPAVNLGLMVAGQFPARDLPGFAHTDEDRSPGPIGNTPVEMLVGDDRSSTGGDRA